MDVILEAIKFNHDPTGKTTGAFNLRRNETETIPIPEWPAGRGISAVAYAISEVPATISIKAKFSCDDLSIANIRIRALDGTLSELPLELRPQNVLGEVKARSVSFRGGQSDFEIFNLINNKVLENGATISNTVFRWQFSLDGRNWQDIGTTTHRVYTVPRLPTSPWEPRSGDATSIHLPWTEVLDYACHWAAGQEEPFLAAAAITRAVNALGAVLATYQTGPAYTNLEKFNCTAFILLLKTGRGFQTLNCDDCAAIVSTFANILGCDLSQSGIGSRFLTNRILLIGESFWRHTSFIHHSVAWDGACLENNVLFDACLQIDTDHKPGSPPQKPQQPASIRFGNSRETDYAFALAKDSDCEPIPHDPTYGRRRRRFGEVRLSQMEIEDQGLLDLLKRVYDFQSWPQSERAGNAKSAKDLYQHFERYGLFHDWRLDSYEESFSDRGTKILRALLAHADKRKPSELLAIYIFESAPSRDPSSFLLQLLGNFEEQLERLESPAFGEVAFVSAGKAVVLFRWKRLVVAILSAGRTPVPILEGVSTMVESLAASNLEIRGDRKISPSDTYDEGISLIKLNDERRKAMHKFGHVWRNWQLVNDPSQPAELIDRGSMDFRNMDDSGVLAPGDYYTDERGHRHTISATAIQLGNLISLSIYQTDGAARWEGLLVFDYKGTGDVMVIAGTLFTPLFVAGRSKIFDQNEEPWVITKP